jgi:DNA invertase Pin-like site-specific DNA recombinase
MLKRKFDPLKPLPVVTYARMSSDDQNPRSPQQQRDTIEATIQRLGYPWKICKSYVDKGISGCYLSKRPGFQRMLSDIRTGTVKIDAILVDTFERFGRAEELAGLRQELQQKHGVLILTADSQFTDPTSASGKALAAFESLRATEDNRIKAHNVLRGKRDAVRQRHWPGGPPPFGYKLESVMVERHGRQEVDHCILVPDPDTAWIIQRLFELASTKGLGSTRLARMCNHDPEIPDKYKPFYDQTVIYWLRHPIYYGELIWEQHSTAVVDDRRVIEPNPEDEVVRVPDFCEPLVSREVWDAVQEIRRVRSERARQARQARKDNGDKQIAAVTPGLALTYMLSGLVRCGHCNRSMTVSAGPAYTTKSGETKRYASYVCPGVLAGVCPNRCHVPESWLRQTVVELIRQRLFPGRDRDESQMPSSGATGSLPDSALNSVCTEEANSLRRWTVQELQQTDWFGPLLDQIQRELDILSAQEHDARPRLHNERERLRQQIQGWSQSLAKPALSLAVRELIEKDVETAVERSQEIEQQLAEVDALQRRVSAVVDAQQVVDRLNRLADVLAAHNPSRTNMELSLHIDAIRCFQDGSVAIRTCKLGALAGSTDLFARPQAASKHDTAGDSLAMAAKPRRRAVRRVSDEGVNQSEMRDAAHRAADVHRFSGLGPEWFWEDSFQIPVKKTWPEVHAREVAAKKAEGWPMAKLVEHFGRSAPTIRLALRLAQDQDRTRNSGELPSS